MGSRVADRAGARYEWKRMIKLNQPAPDFQARTTGGSVFKLSEMRGRPMALFFFPRAFSPG
jgi:peroxiredoxin